MCARVCTHVRRRLSLLGASPGGVGCDDVEVELGLRLSVQSGAFRDADDARDGVDGKEMRAGARKRVPDFAVAREAAWPVVVCGVHGQNGGRVLGVFGHPALVCLKTFRSKGADVILM